MQPRYLKEEDLELMNLRKCDMELYKHHLESGGHLFLLDETDDSYDIGLVFGEK